MNVPIQPRRTFLADVGHGFAGLALGAMLQRDGILRATEHDWRVPDGNSVILPRAKSVIWLFMIGGVSHMESFDPKPALNEYAGQTFSATPYAGVLTSSLVEETIKKKDLRSNDKATIFPLQVGYRPRGESGIEVSDWFPHIGGCIDDIAVVRSMWTTDDNHGAQYQFHTGRNKLDGVHPSIGSWVHYGLGTLNENLPQFVVLGHPIGGCCGGIDAHGASYLSPEHAGVQMNVDPVNPLPYLNRRSDVPADEQRDEFELLGRLNQLAAVEYPDDPFLAARIRAYELAFRMQQAVPEAMNFAEETDDTHRLYGLDQKATRDVGLQCLLARRLVERGTRFVQVFHGGSGGAGRWDGHAKLRERYQENCLQVDQPVAGLLRDLKRRGLLDETLVVFATEFGRTPNEELAAGSASREGRNHHPFGFSVWLAGGGMKGGVVHGATDELGFHAVENRHYVTDIHATVLHQLGLDARRLEVPGRKRLEIDFGEPIREIMA